MAVIKRLPWSVGNTLFGSPFHIQLHVTINTMDPLVIKAMTIKSNPVIALLEAPARALLDDAVQRVDNRFITLQPVFSWPI